jgi:hypothetical protein
MKLDRTKTILKKQTKQDDCFVNASFQERISFVWELTSELWSLKGNKDAERRLQRHVTNLIISKENLIQNKKSTGRDKDLVDAKHLEENGDA